MSKRIIIINGKGGIGKDTLIRAIATMPQSIEVYNESSIDPIRSMIARAFGGSLDEELSNAIKDKNNAYRTLLADMKKAVDNYYTAICGVKYTEEYLYRCAADYSDDIGYYQDSSDDSVMFVHIREPENIKAFVERVKSKLPVKVATLLITSNRAKKDYGNDSDNNVENYNYDFVYQSDGCESYERENFRKFFLSEIMKWQ